MKKIPNNLPKQKEDINKVVDTSNLTRDKYDLPNGPFIVPIINKDNEICNIAVNITDEWNKAYDYARNNSNAFSGQCLVVLYERPTYSDEIQNIQHGKYNPTAYIIKNTGIDVEFEFVGTVLTYHDAPLFPKSKILLGELCTYKNNDYYFDGIKWNLIKTNDITFINSNIINTVDDIISAFDELQEVATKLGYPIKVFSKDRPIHPSHSIDAKLTLKRDDTCPNTILAAINVKESLEYIMYNNGGKLDE